jgi:hypothetical protein
MRDAAAARAPGGHVRRSNVSSTTRITPMTRCQRRAQAFARRHYAEDAAGAFVLRHRDRILSVTALPQASQVVEVPDGAALHRLAARLDTFVLHAEGPDGQGFVVQDGPTSYRFTPPPAPHGTLIGSANGRHSARRGRHAPSLRGLIGRLALI